VTTAAHAETAETAAPVASAKAASVKVGTRAPPPSSHRRS
jgi:hypothetical protein